MSSYLYFEREEIPLFISIIRSENQTGQLCQETPSVVRPGPGDAQPPGEDVQLGLQQPHLLGQLGPGGRDEGRVNPGVQTSARVDTEGVALLGGGASQHGHQAGQWSHQATYHHCIKDLLLTRGRWRWVWCFDTLELLELLQPRELLGLPGPQGGCG